MIFLLKDTLVILKYSSKLEAYYLRMHIISFKWPENRTNFGNNLKMAMVSLIGGINFDNRKGLIIRIPWSFSVLMINMLNLKNIEITFVSLRVN